MKKGISKFIILVIFLSTLSSNKAMAIEFKDISAVGLAFLTNLGIHEAGHYIIADQAGAEGNSLIFFRKDKNSFFLGLSTVTGIDNRARPSYHLAGEVAASYTFEFALQRYRNLSTHSPIYSSPRIQNPVSSILASGFWILDSDTYNNALLFFSMTDFLWYTAYAFYLSPHENEKFDPIGIANSTGISRDTIFLVALTQSTLNAIRVYTNQDRFIPYYMLDRYFIGAGVKVPF